MRTQYDLLIRKLVRFYAGISIGLVIIMNAYNAYIDGAPWSHIFSFDFYFVVIGNVGIFLLLYFFTTKQLRNVKRFFNENNSSNNAAIALHDLLNFPRQLGASFIFVCFVLSIIYHSIEIMVLNLRTFDLVVIRHLIIELSACLAFAMLLSGIARIYASRCATKIVKTDIHGIKTTSFLWQWFGTFFSLFMVTGFILMWSVINWESKGELSLSIVIAAAVVVFVFGFCLVKMLTYGFITDIRTLIQAMDGLHKEEKDKLQVIPITSHDEIGQLAAAFNQLQEQVEREYEGVRQELLLAYDVQQRILPPTQNEIGSFQITCYLRPAREVGGDLYDVLRLTEQEFVVVIGDVSGQGMPAALVMSAVVAQFRAEARRGGTASQIMTRLNQQFCKTLKDTMMVTLGIGLLDIQTGSLTYSSAGHLAPYILSKDRLETLMMSSLPLGIDADEIYQEKTIVLREDDCLFLYTDGVIEQMDAEGKLLGFEGLEEVLDHMRQIDGIEDKLNFIKSKIAHRQQFLYDDDWSVVMVQRSAEEGVEHVS